MTTNTLTEVYTGLIEKAQCGGLQKTKIGRVKKRGKERTGLFPGSNCENFTC